MPQGQTEQKIEMISGEEVVVTVTKPGDFVVCNLASLSLGNLCVTDYEQLSYVTESAVRALDNVIDLNFFPVPYAEINSKRYRPVGLGVSGYHHMLAKHKIQWESEEHLKFAEKVFSDIHYAALAASSKFPKKKDLIRISQAVTGRPGIISESGISRKDAGKHLKTGSKNTACATAICLPRHLPAVQASSPAPRQVWTLS